MVSSMAPAILLHEGEPFLVLGARGGSRIPTSLVQVIVRIVDFGMDLPEAVALPRIHYQWEPDVLYYEKDLAGSPALSQLEEMGYQTRELTSSPGKVQALRIHEGTITGAADPREGGAVVGF
jgi:gamma-glutamyltranspeptidase/glutathione hydrolase